MLDTALRSVLYMPGANARAMEKARSLPADALVFDLEDAVAPDHKEAARVLIAEQLARGGYGARQLVVRCNGVDTHWCDEDLRSMAAAGATTMCLPKVESAAQVLRALEILDACGAASDITLWAMIETPQGVDQVEQIAASSPRLTALLMGTTDLSHELRIPQREDRLGLLYALSRSVNAARMAGIVILDSVYLNFSDRDAFARDCELGRALGFDGKTLIHPSQIETANAAFGLPEGAMEHAHRVIAAWQDASAEGKGVAVLDGKLVETMHVDAARRTLAQAESIQQLQQQGEEV